MNNNEQYSYKSIGYRLKEFRKKLNISQKELANVLDVAQPFISAIESGKHSIPDSKLNLLNTNYNLSTGWLLFGEGEMLLKNNKKDNYKNNNTQNIVESNEFNDVLLEKFFDENDKEKEVKKYITGIIFYSGLINKIINKSFDPILKDVKSILISSNLESRNYESLEIEAKKVLKPYLDNYSIQIAQSFERLKTTYGDLVGLLSNKNNEFNSENLNDNKKENLNSK